MNHQEIKAAMPRKTKTFLVSARTKPAPKSEHFGSHTGALWTIWVLAEKQSEAIAKALAHIEQAGWIDPQCVVGAQVNRAAHCTDDKLLSQFDLAQTAGIAATFDTFRGGGRFQ